MYILISAEHGSQMKGNRCTWHQVSVTIIIIIIKTLTKYDNLKVELIMFRIYICT